MGVEPSRRLFGGKAAVQAGPGANISNRAGEGVRLDHARLLLVGGIVASAVLAITAALAWASASPLNPATAKPTPVHPQTLTAIASRTLDAASARSAVTEADADAFIQRFTGRVGPDLS